MFRRYSEMKFCEFSRSLFTGTGALITLLVFTGCGTPRTGLYEERLQPCPTTPNCVTSMPDGGNTVDPITYAVPTKAAVTALVDVLESMEGGEVVEVKDNYIHAVFRSAIFGFADDVEFLFYESINTVHVRSAARTGYYDFGVNRRRLEKIRSLFRKKTANMMTREITEPDK